MKKFFSFLLMLVAFIPTFVFGACSKSEDASAVKNKVYYVTKVFCKGEDVSKSYTDNNMRIIFYENTFMVIYSQENDTTNYGYYLGSFKTNATDITLAVTEAGGTYKNYNQNPEKKASVFSSLRYSTKKLYTEFAFNGSIYSFTLEEK